MLSLNLSFFLIYFTNCIGLSALSLFPYFPWVTSSVFKSRELIRLEACLTLSFQKPRSSFFSLCLLGDKLENLLSTCFISLRYISLCFRLLENGKSGLFLKSTKNWWFMWFSFSSFTYKVWNCMVYLNLICNFCCLSSSSF